MYHGEIVYKGGETKMTLKDIVTTIRKVQNIYGKIADMTSQKIEFDEGITMLKNYANTK
jgi:hypothetical protein